MTKRALIVVDYSNDFVAPNGALTCGEAGQAIEPFIVSRIEEYNNSQDTIFFMMDLHYEDDPFHPESQLFPPHNIEGTLGRELYGRVNDIYQRIQYNDYVHYLDKTRYDSFSGTPLDLMLRERGITELEIVGVCTDICVLHTAVDAYNKGFKLAVYEKGTASFNEAGHDWALKNFQHALGAKVIS